jgi:hypothetical protein
MKASTSQRSFIQKLLKRAELLTPVVSIIHRNLFTSAGIWKEALVGTPLDQCVFELNGFEAGRLIAQLKLELKIES